MKLAEQKVWDVLIIGGGPAGLSAATVLARSRRSVAIIDEGRQRNLRSHGLHNYITRDGILPADFLDLVHEEIKQYPVSFFQGRALSVTRSEDQFSVSCADGNNFISKRLLLATGVSDQIPEVAGMKELWGKSIFHCPFCDGFECKEQHVGLYAQQLNGYGMALALKHIARKLTLFTDGGTYLRLAQKQKLEQQGIEVITKRIRKLLLDKGQLQGLELEDGRTVDCTALFTHHGISTNRSLLDQLGCRSTKKGAAITNRHQQTNVDGVYVAGDASIDMHFVVVAAAEGVKAAVAIHNDLLEKQYAEVLKYR